MNQKRSRGRRWVYLSGSTIYNNHSNIILMLSTLAIILVHWLAMKTAYFSISTPRLGDPSKKVKKTRCFSSGRPCLIYCGHLQVIILHTIQLQYYIRTTITLEMLPGFILIHASSPACPSAVASAVPTSTRPVFG